MKLHNADLRRMLAAEYALGTLRGRARLRLERLAVDDPEIMREIQMWETRLGVLASGVAPVQPPERVWIGLQKRIANGNTVALHSGIRDGKGASTPTSGGAPLWRIAAGLATAAAVVLAVLINQRSGPAVIPTATPVVVAAPSAAPMNTSYVALLKMPDSDMQWTVSLTPGHGQMTSAATGSHPAALDGRSAELWWLSSKGPVAIGVLPEHGNGTLALPRALGDETEVKLAISLEPPGGSPTGAPTGPVVTSAVAVKTA